MSDGALLGLTTSVMADRNRTRYGEAVSPDENVSDPVQLIQRAVVWLETGN